MNNILRSAIRVKPCKRRKNRVSFAGLGEGFLTQPKQDPR